MTGKLFQEKNQLSSLVRRILPGDPSEYTIAILISSFVKSEGASRVAELQARELSEIGYSVTVYAFESDISPIGYNVETIDSWIQTRSPHLKQIYRAIFPFNIWKSLKISSHIKNSSLIITHQETLVTIAHFTKYFYGSKLIYWHHHIAEFHILPLKVKLYNLSVSPFNWRLIKKFDIVVSISDHSRTILQKEKDIDSIVIYDKIDTARFNENRVNGYSIRKKYHIESDEPVILFVGRIIPTKNIHSLIAAFKVVKKSLPCAKLIIVGKIYNNLYSDELRRGCDHSVIFTGFVPDEELPNYYAACDVYATCSILEGFNMPLVEAQACGKPVVAFDIGPHKETVQNGFLIPEGDIDGFGETLIKILSRTGECLDNGRV